MKIEQFIATVKVKTGNNIIQTFVVYSNEKRSDEKIIEEARIKLSNRCSDNYELNVTERKELVEINTDLLPTDNGKIPNPDGELLRGFKTFILKNRTNLIGNNRIELFYDSQRKKMEIIKFNPTLSNHFFKNLPEEYQNLF